MHKRQGSSVIDLLTKQRSLAGPGFNRWLSLAPVMASQLCLGQVYAVSVFIEPLARLLGVTHAVAGDWRADQLEALFTVAVFAVGVAAFCLADWVYAVGPRAAMFLAACLFGGGMLIGSVGIATHLLWVLYLGYGVVGGIGIGLGYIAPIPALLQWFPDRAGLATGLAIAAFGAAGVVAVPLSGGLLAFFAGARATGVSETFLVLGLLYWLVIGVAAFAIKLPGVEQLEARALAPSAKSLPTGGTAGIRVALRSRQFYLMATLLGVNVTTGIDVIGSAPAMLTAVLGERSSPALIAGFVGFLGLSGLVGRVLFSYASDYLGRKNTVTVILVASFGAFVSVPLFGPFQNVPLVVIQDSFIVALYGGLFATIPAYVRDVFGSEIASRIHGRLLLAWSVGAVLAFLIARFNAHQLVMGVAPLQSSVGTAAVLSALVLVALIANWRLRPLQAQGSAMAGEGARAGRGEVRQWLLPAVLGVGFVASLIVGGISTVKGAANFNVLGPVSLTLLPLLLGTGVCIAFIYLDQSRFAVRGVVGPYFAALALLFGLYASLLATEVWQRISREGVLLRAEVGALQAMGGIAQGVGGDKRAILEAIDGYAGAMAGGNAGGLVDATASPLRRLYGVAADKELFQGNTSSNAAFYGQIEVLRSSRGQRAQLMVEHIEPIKTFSLLLFGFLTQISIAFCHAGNRRAIGLTVMLFSVGFAAAIGILELLDVFW